MQLHKLLELPNQSVVASTSTETGIGLRTNGQHCYWAQDNWNNGTSALVACAAASLDPFGQDNWTCFNSDSWTDKFTARHINKLLTNAVWCSDRLCGLAVRVLGYRSGGPGSIPGTTRKKKVVGLERDTLSLVSTTEELLDRKVAAPV
jgi:hypothetical protein